MKIIQLTQPLPRNGSYIAGKLFRQFLIDNRLASDKAISEFSDAFRYAKLPSIDAFLAERSSNQEYVNIGKRAIAWIIAEHENVDMLDIESQGKEDWYQHLWSCISPNFKKGTQSLLTIITFNYDRSLEIYLLRCIENTFGLSSAEAAKQLNKVRIIHIYGQLGDYDVVSKRFRGYKFDAMDRSSYWADLETSAQMIRVIGDRGEDETLQEVRSILRRSRRICFLGFAYDEQNLQALGFNEPEWYRHISDSYDLFICGSALDISIQKLRRILLLVNRKLVMEPETSKSFFQSHFVNVKCLSALKETDFLR